MRKVILASQSPRRREILTMMGVEFEVFPSEFDEYLDDNKSPEEVSMALGLGKAMDIAREFPEAIVIGSDTIATIDGKQLAKASSDDEAREMLRLLSGNTHKVTTSIAVVCLKAGIEIVDSENSYVTFKQYDGLEIEKYIATGDYRDKAGAYGIQSGAASLIESVSGDIDNIVGLPSVLLARILSELGVKAKKMDYNIPDIVIRN